MDTNTKASVLFIVGMLAGMVASACAVVIDPDDEPPVNINGASLGNDNVPVTHHNDNLLNDNAFLNDNLESNENGPFDDNGNDNSLFDEEICDNGVDDNGDGLVDCDDGECILSPLCEVENCNNLIDDDGDGLVDCADIEEGAGAFECVQESVCFDNVDNDGDGFTDCDDPDCITSPGC